MQCDAMDASSDEQPFADMILRFRITIWQNYQPDWYTLSFESIFNSLMC